VYRGRSTYKGISLGKASTGRIVDWKPPGKDTPSQPASGGSQALSASKDAKAPEPAPTPSMILTVSDCYEITHVECLDSLWTNSGKEDLGIFIVLYTLWRMPRQVA